MYKKFDIAALVAFTSTLKVLYVEDNKEATDAMIGLLSNFFEDIDTAVNGEEGLQKFTNNAYDLIISDIRMPKINGLEMIRRIRDVDIYIPIIITTAHEETEYLLKSIEYSVNGYLLKPINLKQLEKIIKQSCEKIYYKKKTEKYEESLESLVQCKTEELREANKSLEDIAQKDPLTGLYNRRYFNDVSESLFKLALREDKKLSILMLDIDKFKSVNDTYGHLVGDDVLQMLAKTLLFITRDSDVAVRFGGEEFIILLPNTQEGGAYKIAQKICSTVAHQEIIVDKEDTITLKITLSIGVTECLCDVDRNIDDLIYRADKALYKAKEEGRNRVVVYAK